MRKQFLFIVGLLILSINGYAVDYTATQAGNWTDAATWGGTPSTPGAGDNVNTGGFAITISADATCDNLTVTNVAGQLGIGAGVTLTVRGVFHASAVLTVDVFSTMDATGILKLTCATLADGAYCYSDNAAVIAKPKNIIIESANPSNTYLFGQTNKNFPMGSGKFTVKSGTKLTVKTIMILGFGVDNELVIEEGATATFEQNVKGDAGNATKVTKITINGTLTANAGINATTLIIGNNGYFKSMRTKATAESVDNTGWWIATGAGGATLANYGIPTTVTIGTNGTIEYAATGTGQYVQGLLPGTANTIPYVNIKISNANAKTIQSNVNCSGILDIESARTLTIASGKTLTLASTAKVNNAGTIANAGTLNLLSDATNGTATITGAGTITNTGTINVNQSLQHPSSALRTWYVSSPVNTAIAPIPALTTIKAFDEAANTWSASSLTNMDPKVGYMVVPADAANNLLYTTTGLLNTGAQNITLTGRAGVGANQGFNLVGNPYPSYLDWAQVSAANGVSILRSSSMWYRTKDAGVYSFWTVNGAGVGTPATATKEIPPMQAFWVRAAEGGSTLALTDAMRVHAPASNKLLKAPAVNDLTLVRLQVSNGVNTDEAVIYFSENAQNGIDMLDAPKMSNNNVNIPEIHTTLGSEKYAINSMNSITLDTPISLGFVAGNASAFSITANEVTNLPAGVKLMLRDNVTLAETDLTDGNATYSFAPETTSTDRFSVIFRSAGATTGLENAIKNDVQVYVNANHQIVIVAAENTDYAIYNAIGSLVEKGVSTSKLQTTNYKLNAGVYVVKTNSISKKVIVK